MHLFEGSLRYEARREYFNYGFKVIFHDPFEYPDATQQSYTVSLNQSYMFLITPQLHTIDDSLIGLSPEE